ncbi:MAG: Polyribonucleotide nucleotidyltransferase [Mycoplasmataceae bacterium]|nr:MAG: Polyribonucleotide nucleotidyltransferase [Mycoplasmataceae bacterium]
MIYNKKEKKFFSFDFQGKNVTFEIDSLALRSDKSILCRYGNTTVLTTLCTKNVEEDVDFVKLTVFLEEKFYSIGRIPAGFNKREARSSYDAILISRLIDRSLRSCLSISDKKEIQITNTILSLDDDHDVRLVACWNSFLSVLLCEKLSFNKLISTSIIAENDGNFIFNPSYEQLKKSSFEFIITSSEEKILMLEMFSKELDESKTYEIANFAFEQNSKMINQVFSCFLNSELLSKKINLTNSLSEEKENTNLDFDQIKLEISNFIKDSFSFDLSWDERKFNFENFPIILSKKYPKTSFVEIDNFWNKSLKEKISSEIIEKNKRIDGRGVDQIRDINININYLPNVHGSALFSRGNTNVLSVLTFGKSSERQIIDDGLSKSSYHKNFIHHYNFPGFAVNNLSVFKSTSRREIGHGQLAEKTFFHLIPSVDIFPYTTRIVSEVISSEGSSSQASICASSLAMMSSGFPLKKHVAGIALGLFNDEILTDINDFEDKLGEMDLKIAGTEDGICSFQMDVKNNGISLELFYKSLQKAKNARLLIIKKMNEVISETNSKLPNRMIKCKRVYFGSDKLGLIIGQGGKNINLVTSKTGTKIDFQDDGFALIYHSDDSNINEAYEMMRKFLIKQSKL